MKTRLIFLVVVLLVVVGFVIYSNFLVSPSVEMTKEERCNSIFFHGKYAYPQMSDEDQRGFRLHASANADCFE